MAKLFRKVVASILLLFSLITALITMHVPVEAATTTTQPTTTSAASLYLSNWNSMQGIWMASKLNQNDTGNYGPRIGELHFSTDWPTNQINDYSGFFRDETNSVKYDSIHSFDSSAYIDSNGILNTQYLNYNGTNLPVSVSRNYAMVPNQNFMVVQYNITNLTASSLAWNVLDQVHFSTKNTSVNQHGWYDSTRNAILNDMSAAGQPYMALGALQAPTSYQVGNDADSTLTDAACAGWYTFDNNGTLNNNSDVHAANVDAAFENLVTIPANGTTTLYYYVVADASLSLLQNDIDTIRAQTGAYWFNQTSTAWTNWLNSGQRINTSDTGVNTAYDRNLIVIKEAQNPTTGAIPASTNPSAYGENVWARDSAFAAMAFDASGHYTEAEQYWYWLANQQNTDGSFHTRFNLWTSQNSQFVEPENDSIGAFLLGVYNHIRLTGKGPDDPFVAGTWYQVQQATNFIMNNMNSSLGFGPQDYSIWEQSNNNIEYYTFTQAMYVAGLDSAQLMARMQNNQALADSWNGAASGILTAIQTSSQYSGTAIWNQTGGYYIQGVDSINNTMVNIVDSSTDVLFGWGVIDANSSRAASHLQTVVNSLTHDTWGIARYPGDTFYYTNQWSPAGDESGAPEPVWPQMTNYVALQRVFSGNLTEAFSRLQYYVARSAVGYMPPGEAVSWYYQTPIVSTMSEPLTAASYVIVCLAYANQYDGRVIPPQYNAGSYATVSVTSNPSGDWSNWSAIPYFVHRFTDSNPANNHIKNVAISNDANNLYIRIDNTSGTLPGYNTAPLFAVQIYSEDYNHSNSVPSSATGMYGTLDRPMSYLVARWSNDGNYARFHFTNGSWVYDYNISNVIAPQWDPSTGRVELVVPLSAIASSGTVSSENWANLNIVLSQQDPASGNWLQGDLQPIHYKIAASNDQWIYGNVR